ncbi:MAG TPA: hypothetical protein VG651_25585 [Stellaceae bacterium]|nr:hypothetical protein [Stellaceae bacterium]
MEKSGKRGKIPQADWPLIMARYEQGETLSSIARTYDCSPPAISYIVSRSREKPATEAAAAQTVESQLVKARGNGAATNGSAPVETTDSATSAAPAEPHQVAATDKPAPDDAPANGAPANGAPANGTPGNGAVPEQRRPLRLSLGNGHNGAGNQVNGNGRAADPAASPNGTALHQPQPSPPGNGHQPLSAKAAPAEPNRETRDLFMPAEAKRPQQAREPEAARKENGAFIDRELRNRVDGDIAAFLAAFDAALASDTQENRFGLREATDRLLRAGARTRIELERLEARVPLTPREGRAGAEAAWRYRQS